MNQAQRKIILINFRTENLEKRDHNYYMIQIS